MLNNHHFQGKGNLLIRLLAANFPSIRMQQNSNLHTMLKSEFTVIIYRGGYYLVNKIGRGDF